MPEGTDRLTSDGTLIAQCKTCHHSFRIDVEEQEFYRRRGLKLPRRCPVCRRLSAARRNGHKPIIDDYLNTDLEVD